MSPTAEVITRVAPLGLRFVDDVTGATVRDGLTVTYRTAAGDGRAAAVLTPHDVFAIHDVPGLRASERGAGDGAYWAAPPATTTIRIEVDDDAGRYVPISFPATVPHRGVLDLPCAAKAAAGSPPPHSPPLPPGPPAVPLLSAPTRATPPGMAAVRAELRDAASGRPASFAVLEVGTAAGGPVGRGLADARGVVLVLLAYPPPPGALAGGPRALTAATWTLQLRVRYAPGAVSAPHPDLCGALGQPPATAVSSVAPLVPLTTWPIVYGQDAVLRSMGESVLLVHP